MRMNLPLTGHERSFDQSQRLISATDASGKILSCNDEFQAISGYTRQELIGSPHNIVRHPDMPPSANDGPPELRTIGAQHPVSHGFLTGNKAIRPRGLEGRSAQRARAFPDNGMTLQ
jgi:PAS domain S-box-containing protein